MSAEEEIKAEIASGTLKVKKLRGFAAMSPEDRRAISSRGGKKVQELGTGHRFDANEAREAGKKSWKSRKGEE